LSRYEDGVKEFHDMIRRAVPVVTLDDAPDPGQVAAADAEISGRAEQAS
jgi:hypothetical protein